MWVEGVIDPPDPDYISPEAITDERKISWALLRGCARRACLMGQGWVRLLKSSIAALSSAHSQEHQHCYSVQAKVTHPLRLP